jgi:hypothetical protein
MMPCILVGPFSRIKGVSGLAGRWEGRGVIPAEKITDEGQVIKRGGRPNLEGVRFE